MGLVRDSFGACSGKLRWRELECPQRTRGWDVDSAGTEGGWLGLRCEISECGSNEVSWKGRGDFWTRVPIHGRGGSNSPAPRI
ncbi:Uncharacterised protein [Sphingobacterium mizutaii]|uniref:Uncharacterized protein n=1 Tax=Sphingobacterium mizutaii TaxID=1010 RepID=A0AAJ4XDM2_9SPHI|nr:Uncharacterised protein [Sphingobacterium mizutaii]